jgi:hypothetical protein
MIPPNICPVLTPVPTSSKFNGMLKVKYKAKEDDHYRDTNVKTHNDYLGI